MRRWIAAGVGIVAVAVVASRVAVVSDDDMAPSYFAGDLVVLAPLMPRPGDVVPIVDPLDPSRWTLRRVEGIGGAVRIDDGVVHSSDGDERILEMGRDEAFVTLGEGPHLVRIATRPVRWSMDEAGVPDDAAFLAADDRDVAMDSRWWGPLPLDALQGVVIARIGLPKNRWRGWIAGRGA